MSAPQFVSHCDSAWVTDENCVCSSAISLGGGWEKDVSNALMKGKASFLMYLLLCQWSGTVWRCPERLWSLHSWRYSNLNWTQPWALLTLLWAGAASGHLQRCLQHQLFYDPWEKLFYSKAAVSFIFLIMASLSTRHNSAKYVTSSSTGKVIHLFFTVFLSFCDVKAWCISTDLCF